MFPWEFIYQSAQLHSQSAFQWVKTQFLLCMQLTQCISTAVKIAFLYERWREEFKDPAWGWVRIVYHSAEFYKAMCTSMACRAGNYSCSLGSLFIIPSKYTGASVRVTLINSLEVKASVLSTAWLQLSFFKAFSQKGKAEILLFSIC